MKTYNQIHFSRISEILIQAALGVSAVCDCKHAISDMVYSLSDLSKEAYQGLKEPYYIAIREMGTESGFKELCLVRCKGLGYPLVIAKIEANKVCDYNMTIMFTQNRDFSKMEQEFNSL